MAVKKCPSCGKEFQRLDAHMRSHQVKPKPPQINISMPPPNQFVTKGEFEVYRDESNIKLDQMLALLQEGVGKPTVVSDEEVASPVAETNIPRDHENIFSKYFDREDGFDAELDIIENNFYIIVPPKFSNASPAQAEYYPVDKRMVHLDGHNPLGSVEEYCQRVCRNLKYDKNIKTK